MNGLKMTWVSGTCVLSCLVSPYALRSGSTAAECPASLGAGVRKEISFDAQGKLRSTPPSLNQVALSLPYQCVASELRVKLHGPRCVRGVTRRHHRGILCLSRAVDVWGNHRRACEHGKQRYPKHSIVPTSSLWILSANWLGLSSISQGSEP
ncbi:Uncharacterized protein HZ326_19308 [Fusarium oxysporum f. sp. albedinis]|nr:Uncharacterized protein HZ326_19308 [Fusarium oxysporum f. sp. albedinis]